MPFADVAPIVGRGYIATKSCERGLGQTQPSKDPDEWELGEFTLHMKKSHNYGYVGIEAAAARFSNKSHCGW